MSDPYRVLELPIDADDAAIRRRYLELVRRWPPEHAPERFQEIRQAYEKIHDRDARLSRRLFDADLGHDLSEFIQEVEKRSRRRVSRRELLDLARGA